MKALTLLLSLVALCPNSPTSNRADPDPFRDHPCGCADCQTRCGDRCPCVAGK